MEFDFKKADEQKSQTAEQLSRLLKSQHLRFNHNVEFLGKTILDCINFIPPEKPKISLDLVTLNPSGRGGTKSIKPGNIVFNLGILIEGIANGTLIGASVCQIPWLAPFGLLLLYRSFLKASTIEITENEASLLYTMWVFRDKGCNKISQNNLREHINEILTKYGRKVIMQKEVNISLNRLEKIGCIERSENNIWFLRERVIVKYK